MYANGLFKLIISLGFFVAGILAEEQGKEKKPATPQLHYSGHLDCTNYYTPCAVDCFHINTSIDQNLQALQQAINNQDFDRLNSLFGQNIVIADFVSTNVLAKGTCGLAELFENWFPIAGHTVLVERFAPFFENDGVTSVYYVIVYKTIQGVTVKEAIMSATFVKNACGSWVQDLLAGHIYTD